MAKRKTRRFRGTTEQHAARARLEVSYAGDQVSALASVIRSGDCKAAAHQMENAAWQLGKASAEHAWSADRVTSKRLDSAERRFDSQVRAFTDRCIIKR